ncbi:MAG: hypothetical protein A3D44_03740 [Candidatus Staskawiczbacteria bacterium RIFCSPHIGHO2_02_FULL_42_22]|uniref:SHS2 domain-containing protein n=1 Tax=Candidatus Staskawiczbacteria bacterium RIFCSPHIGHO2_02_FULL_42_22 TaxID=1802207 RepID=A0A1G2I4T7_9BACT|nr:MAG: hypothetical protein A3D44_03740 [Candidatus Staskawiczbacteria bacterium RIFCSPHIGHO2_02_FULL_42_22]
MARFLSLEKEVFGLDISDLSLKIIKLKKRGDFFSVTSYNHMDIPSGIIEKGVIKKEDDLVKIIIAACKNAKGQKLNTRYVISSLPEERSFLQVIQMPTMEPEELRLAVPFEAENYIPLPMDDVYLDFEITTPAKNHVNHLDVLIAAMPKKIVNSYVSCLKKAGLVPVALEVEGEAIARALIKDDNSIAPVVLIDFGKNGTDFIVFAGHSIQFTCSIPISSHQLTQVIAKALQIETRKAEKLKMKFNLDIPAKDARSKKIFLAMEPILNELTNQIKKYLNFYQEHASHGHRDVPETIQKIFICGGGANLQGLTGFLSQKLHVTAELKDFWANVSSRQLQDGVNKNFLSFATALGLALRGFKNSE